MLIHYRIFFCEFCFFCTAMHIAIWSNALPASPASLVIRQDKNRHIAANISLLNTTLSISIHSCIDGADGKCDGNLKYELRRQQFAPGSRSKMEKMYPEGA